MVWDEKIVETISIFYVYVCAIKVEVYVTFLYEGSMLLDMNIYYVYVEVYVNLQVVIKKVLNFSAFSTNECNDMRLRG